jgi:small subunit ribosomal protein S1
MSMDQKEEQSMGTMMEEIEKSMTPIQGGDIIKGTVISVNDTEVLVNIGYIADGIISKQEVSEQEDIQLQESIKPGDEVEVYVLKVDDGEGNVLLSKKRADAIKVWDTFADSLKNNTVFEVTVSEIVKGGAVTYLQGVRAFIPASHLSDRYVEDLNTFVGKTLKVKVIEFDKEKKKIVLSRKEVAKEERAQKEKELWASLQKGEKRTGEISRLTKFGAFVDLGGMDGLIHLSDLSWKRVMDPSEVVAVGDKVEVYVLDFDENKRRISLGLKEVSEDPWASVSERYKVNAVVEGKVVRMMDFGAFVELEPGVDGLVHVSQISEKRIAKPSEVLSIGYKVKVKVLEIKQDQKRMSLSIKEAANEFEEDIAQYTDKEEEATVTLGDLFKDKLKDLKF